MRILFLNPAVEDYLSNGILHGLRSIFGANVVDFPKFEPMYGNCPRSSIRKVRGHGFTLYGTLEDIEIDRSRISDRVEAGYFNLVVFGNIYRQYSLFVEWLKWLDPRGTVLLDGEDTQAIAPFAGSWWRRPATWLWPAAHQDFCYFKREWGPGTLHYRSYRLLPECLSRFLHHHMQLEQVSFSIPEEKLIVKLPIKTKDFASHIVDPDVSARLGFNGDTYLFLDEQDYYADLRSSRFGITTKRAGWDCLRHYEIAANGTVPCFRNLHLKPRTCAPHGLDDTNCITYTSTKDLFARIARLDGDDYRRLQEGALKWVQSHTTVCQAQFVLNTLRGWHRSRG